MTKIAILADTSQDLTFELGEQFGIEVIPYYLQMGNQHYQDQVDIKSQAFYSQMGKHDVLSTGVPPLQDVTNRLDCLVEQGYDQAFVLTSTLKLTGMRQLYEVILNQYQGLEMKVFESDFIAAGAGILAIYAAQLRDQGKSLEEIYQKVAQANKNVDLFAIFRTLKYVIKGGRFNKYAGMIGSFLNINPLLTIREGEIAMLAKTRGKKKSYQALVNSIKETLTNKSHYMLILFASDNDSELSQLKDELASEITQAKAFVVTELTPVLGVHAGPQALGAAILNLD